MLGCVEALQKFKDQDIQNYVFAFSFVWVWNLVVGIAGGKEAANQLASQEGLCTME